MPKRYVAIRDSAASKRKYRSMKARKKHAAMIENALRRKEGKSPMRPHKD